MSLWLFIDTETTGLDTKVDKAIEVAGILWDSTEKSIICAYSSLVKYESMPVLSSEIEKITGIKKEFYEQNAVSSEYVFDSLSVLSNKADFLCAHNSAFDKAILKNSANYEFSVFMEHVFSKPWIDTMTDMPWAEEPPSKKLSYLAVDHGFSPLFKHRALSDIMTLIKIVSAYDSKEIERLALVPTIEIKANVTYATHKLAKERKYRYNPEDKTWIKSIKADKYDAECGHGFEVIKLENNK